MYTLHQLSEFESMDIEEAKQHGLVPAENIVLDPFSPAVQRMCSFLEQVKNPYCFLCGETAVKVCFSQNGESLGSKLKRYFLGLKK